MDLYTIQSKIKNRYRFSLQESNILGKISDYTYMIHDDFESLPISDDIDEKFIRCPYDKILLQFQHELKNPYGNGSMLSNYFVFMRNHRSNNILVGTDSLEEFDKILLSMNVVMAMAMNGEQIETILLPFEILIGLKNGKIAKSYYAVENITNFDYCWGLVQFFKETNVIGGMVEAIVNKTISLISILNCSNVTVKTHNLKRPMLFNKKIHSIPKNYGEIILPRPKSRNVDNNITDRKQSAHSRRGHIRLLNSDQDKPVWIRPCVVHAEEFIGNKITRPIFIKSK